MMCISFWVLCLEFDPQSIGGCTRFTGFYWVFRGCHGFQPGFLGSTEFYLVLLGFTGFYLDNKGFYVVEKGLSRI